MQEFLKCTVLDSCYARQKEMASCKINLRNFKLR